MYPSIADYHIKDTVMNDLTLAEEEELAARQAFRYYSRKVFLAPNDRSFHEKRIDAAMLLDEREPVQGALADFFYSCWYDVPYDIEDIFLQVKDRLQPQIADAFRDCINKLDYIHRSSVLATRWSILISPSLNLYGNRLRISTDDATKVAKDITNTLMNARDNEDWETIEHIENDFFTHCLARHDRLVFSLVWFRLGKSDWEFDKRWNTCQHKLTLSKAVDDDVDDE